MQDIAALPRRFAGFESNRSDAKTTSAFKNKTVAAAHI